MCFKITSDLFCTNPTTPSSVEAPRPISRYFPRVSEKLVLAAAAEELERAPPRQVPRDTFFEILKPGKEPHPGYGGTVVVVNKQVHLGVIFFFKKNLCGVLGTPLTTTVSF